MSINVSGRSAIVTGALLAAFGHSVEAQNTDEESPHSIKLEHVTERFKHRGTDLTYSPVSELSVNWSFNTLFSAGFTARLAESGFPGYEDTTSDIQRATLNFHPFGQNSSHKISIGKLGDARLFQASFHDSGQYQLRPVTYDQPFFNERLQDFVGLTFDTGMKLGEKWGWSLSATAGQTDSDSTAVTRLDAYEFIRDNDVDYSPVLRHELNGLIHDTFRDVNRNISRFFDNLEFSSIPLPNSDIVIETGFIYDEIDSQIREAVDTAVSGYTGELPLPLAAILDTRDLSGTLSTAIINNIERNDIIIEQGSFVITEDQQAALAEDVRSEIINFLGNARSDTLTSLAETSDEDLMARFDDLVNIAGAHIDFLNEEINGEEFVVMVGGAVRKDPNGVNMKLLANLLTLLRQDRGNSNNTSYFVTTDFSRASRNGSVHIGIEGGVTVPGDHLGTAKEKSAAFFIKADRNFAESFNVSITLEAAGFQNYLNLAELEYAVGTASARLQWTPEKLDQLSLHYGLGATYDIFFGAAIHQEFGAQWRLIDNEKTSVTLGASIGKIRPDDMLPVIDEFEDFTIYNNGSTAAQASFTVTRKFGIR